LGIGDEIFPEFGWDDEDLAFEAIFERDYYRGQGNSPDFCDFCSASGKNIKLRQCGRCRVFRYCSESCQMSDWNSGHRETCGKDPSAVLEETDTDTSSDTEDEDEED
jgi:hypothetical protein